MRNRAVQGVLLMWLLVLVLIPVPLIARDAPLTTAGSSGHCPGDTVWVPVTITNFISVKAISLRLDYDPNQLEWVNFSDINPSLPGTFINNVEVSPSLSKIMMVWSGMMALDLPEGDTLFVLKFTLGAGSPVIEFNNSDNGGGDCEYADENGNPLNDLPTENFYFNAFITNLGAGSAGAITGPQNVCTGSTSAVYNVPPITNATGYSWTLPLGGSIVSGDNTPSIIVNYSASAQSGEVTVAGTNGCGSGQSSSLPVIVTPFPAAAETIIGPDSACIGSAGHIYQIPFIEHAEYYIWGIPPGALITEGDSTNEVVIAFGEVPATGIITVYGVNVCGTGPSSPPFTVAVFDVETPVVSAAGPVLTSSAARGNQWYREGTGAIPGATGQVYVAEHTGWYWTAVNILDCYSDTSNHVYILFEGIKEISGNCTVSIYPVPCKGRFTISMCCPGPESFHIRVYNDLGVMIKEFQEIFGNGIQEKEIELRPGPDGVYTVLIFNDSRRLTRKVVVVSD